MKIETTNNINRTTTKHPQNFKGVLDGALTQTLRTLDTNPMANAVGIDLFAMVGPRTYVDTKERNKYAGAETFFREFTGTLIVCLSASYIAKGISHLANKIFKPETPINPNSWLTKDGVDVLQESWNSTDSVNGYVDKTLSGISKYKPVDWEKVEWVDEKKWDNIRWDNEKYKGIHTKLKSKESITSAISDVITDKTITKKDKKNVLTIIGNRLTNSYGVHNVDVVVNNKRLSSNVPNLVRDIVDMGKDVFTNSAVDTKSAISKITKINKTKALGALAISSGLGLTNQYINRKITEKRTGTKGFVGDTNYTENVSKKTSQKDNSKAFFAEKLALSAGMALMALGVMKVKSPKDFVKKLEFTGPVTSGNAIKTVYASTLIGRFMASDSQDELRETATRDYLGFLNWLVFGGFAAKGVANILDPTRENLFNESKKGRGFRHWINDLSLKTHNEVASGGIKFAKKNIWKLNVAQMSGLAYSTLALGVLLPKLNIFMTKRKQKQNNIVNELSSGSGWSNKYSSLEKFRSFQKQA